MKIYTQSKHPNAFFLDRMITIGKDPVSISITLILILLSLVDRSQIEPSIVATLDSLWQMLPYFLLAIAFAAYAKASKADSLIAQAFSGNPVKATLLAAMVGAISPFCSCGVIPLIAALLGAGVPLAPVMAFWIASPIMDPEMFILTSAGIGLNFALAKTFAAVAMGLLGGFIVLSIQRLGLLQNPLRVTLIVNSCVSLQPAQVNWKFWRDPSAVAEFKTEFSSVGIFLGKWLALAFLLESLMIAYVSSDWIVAYVGAENPFAIPLAAIVGAPSYLNGYAAIPLISSLIDIGMTPGAAMAFATAGAVSSIPAAIAVFALVKKPVFALYLMLGLTGAMLSGWLYQLSGGVI